MDKTVWVRRAMGGTEIPNSKPCAQVSLNADIMHNPALQRTGQHHVSASFIPGISRGCLCCVRLDETRSSFPCRCSMQSVALIAGR